MLILGFIVASIVFYLWWERKMMDKKYAGFYKDLKLSDKYVFSVIGSLILIWLCIAVWGYTDSDYQGENVIGRFHNLGDAIGGISAPFIGLISALLVYVTIKQQIRANDIIVKNNREDKLVENLKVYLELLEKKYAALVVKNLHSAEPYQTIVSHIQSPITVRDSVYFEYQGFSYNSLKNAEDAKILTIEKSIQILHEVSSYFHFVMFLRSYMLKYITDEDISPDVRNIVFVRSVEFTTLLRFNVEKVANNMFILSRYAMHIPDQRLIVELLNHSDLIAGTADTIDDLRESEQRTMSQF